MNPTNSTTQDAPVLRTVFDLESFDEVTLLKQVNFVPAASVDEAVKQLNNDAKKFLEIVNIGLRTEMRNAAAKDSSIPWMVETEDGKIVPFSGTIADMKTVNALRLNLAKSIFGYKADDAGGTADSRREAKEKALDFIRGNDQIKNGLKANAAPASE